MYKFMIIFLLLFIGCNSSEKTETGKTNTTEIILPITNDSKYIEMYRELAIEQMELYGIPASITLAQAIFESGHGNSMLAIKGNNHFGIKCHSSWKGKRLYKDDDKKNECFRSYKTVRESYVDHSKFLQGKRYQFLYDLEPTDYKGWAKGLKKAGYATSKTYADMLIKKIEKNKLYLLDR